MRSSELPSPEPPPLGSDDDPLEGAVADDRPWNFAALVHSELTWVWRLLRRIGLSSADADDAAQQVFLVVARRGAEVSGARIRPFLYGTALRVAANARRSLRRRREVANESAVDAAPHDVELDEVVEQRRARALLDELLGELPAELRRVLVLAEIEQLTTKQIGELEGVPQGTAASRLRRARAAFHALLEREQARNPFVGRTP
jgi:RNA polymerase sigma-70 factor (ECF subfamily)